ncbi:MAG TPA: TlpA disulfide reductase family protein [Candidatus Angelobacter sp.]
MRVKIISVVADMLTGLAAFFLFILGDAFIHLAADLRICIVSLAVLHLGAGFLRGQGRPGNVWLKGLLVSSGSSLVLLSLLWGQLLHPIVVMLLVIANLSTICGVRARRLWLRSASRAALMLLVPLTALASVVVTAIPGLATWIATRQMSAAAPLFSIRKLDGTVVNSAEFRGRVVVLDYWATWCPACRREMPELEKLYRRYQGNSRVSFWAVDVQDGGETPEKARAYMQNAGYTLPIALGGETSSEGLLKLEGFPSLVIIDTLGRVRLIHTGYDRSEQFQTRLSGEIDALLAERP